MTALLRRRRPSAGREWRRRDREPRASVGRSPWARRRSPRPPSPLYVCMYVEFGRRQRWKGVKISVSIGGWTPTNECVHLNSNSTAGPRYKRRALNVHGRGSFYTYETKLNIGEKEKLCLRRAKPRVRKRFVPEKRPQGKKLDNVTLFLRYLSTHKSFKMAPFSTFHPYPRGSLLSFD